jgi:hypothetical protein
MAARRTGKTTIDHDEIQRWAEARGGRPARVKGTGRDGDPGMIRLDFPGFSGRTSLEQISWDEWFKAFEENKLALAYQETTAKGERSNFNKLIGRETVVERRQADSHASRRRGRGGKARSRAGTTASRRSGSRAAGRGGKAKSSGRGRRSA